MGQHQQLFDRSKSLNPGGVHSPVRSFKGLDLPPRFFTHGKGAYITDVDSKDYIDFCMSFGPLILGHTHPEVEEQLHSALKRGWSYGACEVYSLELSEFLLSKLSFDQIRFVNSGTEAVMTALRLARGITGRDKILKFNGCYHGHVDSMLIKAGSGLAGTSEASSKGIAKAVAEQTLICELNDLEAVEKIFKEHKNEIAAIIIEPLPANNGLLIQDIDYLKGLRKICDENESLLIFDEVISGFRVAFGGMTELTGIKPDLVTLGKVIGGGLPVGALVGSKDHMEHLAPVGDVYQAGTLSANPLAMVGGLTTLKLLTNEFYSTLEKQTVAITNLFQKWLKENGHSHKVIQKGSLFWMHPDNDQIKAIHELSPELSSGFDKVFKTFLNKGIYLAPNAYEVGFCSIAHNEEVLKDLEERLWS